MENISTLCLIEQPNKRVAGFQFNDTVSYSLVFPEAVTPSSLPSASLPSPVCSPPIYLPASRSLISPSAYLYRSSCVLAPSHCLVCFLYLCSLVRDLRTAFWFSGFSSPVPSPDLFALWTDYLVWPPCLSFLFLSETLSKQRLLELAFVCGRAFQFKPVSSCNN